MKALSLLIRLKGWFFVSIPPDFGKIIDNSHLSFSVSIWLLNFFLIFFLKMFIRMSHFKLFPPNSLWNCRWQTLIEMSTVSSLEKLTTVTFYVQAPMRSAVSSFEGCGKDSSSYRSKYLSLPFSKPNNSSFENLSDILTTHLHNIILKALTFLFLLHREEQRKCRFTEVEFLFLCLVLWIILTSCKKCSHAFKYLYVSVRSVLS